MMSLGELCHLGSTRWALGPQHRFALRRDFSRDGVVFYVYLLLALHAIDRLNHGRCFLNPL